MLPPVRRAPPRGGAGGRSPAGVAEPARLRKVHHDAPGLASTARDALEVADLLGLDELGALGVSGGGPFAVALACVAPSRVRSLGVVAGVGERPAGDDTAGDPTSTTQDLRADAEASMGPLLALEDAEMVATLFRTVPGGSSRCQDDPGFRATWAADLREGLGTYDGFVRDNLSWGRSWDVDPGRVSAPAFPWFGRDDQVVPSAVVTGHLDREAAPAAACPTVRTPPSRGRQREGGARWVRAVRSR